MKRILGYIKKVNKARFIKIFLIIVIVIAISTFFLLCSFLKIGEQNFDKFFFYAVKYLFRKKDFVYRRCGTWF